MSSAPNIIGHLCSELLRNDAVDDGKYVQLRSKDREVYEAVENHIKQIILRDIGSDQELYASKIIPVVKAVTRRLFNESKSMEEFADVSCITTRIQQLFLTLIEQAKSSSSVPLLTPEISQVSSSELDSDPVKDSDNPSENQRAHYSGNNINYYQNYQSYNGSITVSRVFILQVLKAMHESLVTSPPASTHIAAIIKDKIDVWLTKAHQYCMNVALEEADRAIYGGTAFNPLKTRSYWSDASQFLCWWKNNIERKVRYKEIEQEALLGTSFGIGQDNNNNTSHSQPSPHLYAALPLKYDESRWQRIRWYQQLMKVVRDIKACVSGHASSVAGTSEYRHNATKYFSERSHTNNNLSFSNSLNTNNSNNTALNNSANYFTADNLAISNKIIVKNKSSQPTNDRSNLLPSTVKSAKHMKNISAQPNEDYGQFILTLYDVVTDVQEKSTEWCQNNASFCIVDPVLFICQTLPKFFRLTSAAQFLHLLSVHGFTVRIVQSKQTFRHPLFLKGRRDWAQLMAHGSTNNQVAVVVLYQVESLQSAAAKQEIPLRIGNNNSSSNNANSNIIGQSSNDLCPSDVANDANILKDSTLESIEHHDITDNNNSEVKLSEENNYQSNNNSSDNNNTAMMPQADVYLSMYHHLLHQGYHPLWAAQLLTNILRVKATSLPELLPPVTDAIPESVFVHKYTMNLSNSQYIQNNNTENADKDGKNNDNSCMDTNEKARENDCNVRMKSYTSALKDFQKLRHLEVQDSSAPLAEAWIDFYTSQYRLEQLLLKQQQQQLQAQLFANANNALINANNSTNNSSYNAKKRSNKKMAVDNPVESQNEDNDENDGDHNEEDEFEEENTKPSQNKKYNNINNSKNKIHNNKSIINAHPKAKKKIEDLDETPIIDLRHPRNKRIFMDFTALSAAQRKNNDSNSNKHANKSEGNDSDKSVYYPIYGRLHGKIVHTGDIRHLYGSFIDMEDGNDIDWDIDYVQKQHSFKEANDDLSIDATSPGFALRRRSTVNNNNITTNNSNNNVRRRVQSSASVPTSGSTNSNNSGTRRSTNNSNNATNNSSNSVKTEQKETWFPKRSSRVGDKYQAEIPDLLPRPEAFVSEDIPTKANNNVANNTCNMMQLPSQWGSNCYGMVWSPNCIENTSHINHYTNTNTTSDNITTNNLDKNETLFGDALTVSLFYPIVCTIMKRNPSLWVGSLQFFQHAMRVKAQPNLIQLDDTHIPWMSVGDVVIVCTQQTHTNNSNQQEDETLSAISEEKSETAERNISLCIVVRIVKMKKPSNKTKKNSSIIRKITHSLLTYGEGEDNAEEVENEEVLYEVFDGDEVFTVSASDIVCRSQAPHCFSPNSTLKAPQCDTHQCNYHSSHATHLSEEDLWYLLWQARGHLPGVSRLAIILCDTSNSNNTNYIRNKYNKYKTQTNEKEWGAEEVKQFCSAQRRFGDNVYRIWRQYFATSTANSSNNEKDSRSFRDVLCLFHRLHPSLQRGQSREVCAVFRKMEEMWDKSGANNDDADEEEDENEENDDTHVRMNCHEEGNVSDSSDLHSVDDVDMPNNDSNNIAKKSDKKDDNNDENGEAKKRIASWVNATKQMTVKRQRRGN